MRRILAISVLVLAMAACSGEPEPERIESAAAEPGPATTETTIDVQAAAEYAGALQEAEQLEAFLVWLSTSTTTTTRPPQTTTTRPQSPSPAVSAPPATTAAPEPATGSVWDRLAQCESGGNWAHSGGSYEGGLQFHPGTWRSYGGTAYAAHAYQATRAQQIAIAEKVLADVGWGAWPGCSRKLGLR